MNSFVRTTSVIAAVTLAAAGCTSTAAVSGGASPTASATGSAPTSPSGSPSGSATGSTSGSPVPTVPAFTDDAGKTLSTSDAAAGAVVTSNGVKADVLVHPDSVVTGSVADLGKGATVPSGRVPVFVTVTYTNAGTTTLDYPSLGTYLQATESGGLQAPPYAPAGGVAKCVSRDAPAAFKPGSTFTDCQIFLVHKGTTVAQLTYRPGDPAGEITWKTAA